MYQPESHAKEEKKQDDEMSRDEILKKIAYHEQMLAHYKSLLEKV